MSSREGYSQEFLGGSREAGDGASRTGQSGKQLMDVAHMEVQQHLLLSAVLLAGAGAEATSMSHWDERAGLGGISGRNSAL